MAGAAAFPTQRPSLLKPNIAIDIIIGYLGSNSDLSDLRAVTNSWLTVAINDLSLDVLAKILADDALPNG